MKNSIALFITIMLIMVLSAILSQVLKYSDRYIDESSNNIFLVQLNYVIENFKKEVAKNIKEDNIDDFTTKASNSIPIIYGKNNLKLKAYKMEVDNCDINAYSNFMCPAENNSSNLAIKCENAKNHCNIILEELIDSLLFIDIIKEYASTNKISNLKQFKYLQDIYYSKTEDKMIFNKFNKKKIYFLKIKKENSQNILRLELNGTIFAQNVDIAILYDVNTTDSKVMDIEASF